MRIMEQLNRPRTVLAVAVLITLANVFLYLYSRGALNLGIAGSQSTQTSPSETTITSTTTAMDVGEYSSKVGNIQNSSVQTFVRVNDALRRYDALTANDVADLHSRYQTLSDYKDQVANLSPPQGYVEQYETLNTAIGELYDAAGIAYNVASDPVSATQSKFAEYEQHVDKASADLQQSNELLGQNYDTTEGLPRVGPS